MYCTAKFSHLNPFRTNLKPMLPNRAARSEIYVGVVSKVPSWTALKA